MIATETSGRGKYVFAPLPDKRSTSSRLLNREQFVDEVARTVTRTKRALVDRHVILWVDIDRFRVVSANLGRQLGDHLLSAIAGRIIGQLSRQDSIAWIGGDKFAILMEEHRAPGSATDVAEAIQRELIGGFRIEENTVYMSASIGIARVASRYISAEHVMRDAEIAMYHAKSNGRARAEVFRHSMYQQAIELFDLETDLRRAVERNEFELHFQPIVSLATGKLRAFEALIRWRHPLRGIQQPASFLPLLKETGLIVAVGRWVIREACTHAKEWAELCGKPLPVAINLASQQLAHSGVVETVAEAIAATGVHPGALVFEITEDAVIDDLDVARKTLQSLREFGVRTMIDDFGKGYSSLNYLRSLPIDAIKIDASFVDRIERFAEDRMIVSAIVGLAHALELRVIAEGIERREQYVELTGLDCEEGQGFLISRPVDAATATHMVKTRWVADLS